MGGLQSLFGDALLSQDLAQPGMLVVHVWFPSAARLVVQRSRSAVVVAGQHVSHSLVRVRQGRNVVRSSRRRTSVG
jgi:hypothetical protein